MQKRLYEVNGNEKENEKENENDQYPVGAYHCIFHNGLWKEDGGKHRLSITK